MSHHSWSLVLFLLASGQTRVKEQPVELMGARTRRLSVAGALSAEALIEETDFYKILGVTRNADTKDIKTAYYRMSKQWHPDKHSEDRERAAELFKKIAEAYKALSDPKARKQYDQFGKEGLSSFSNVDSFQLFGMMFGGGKFDHLVGELQLAFFCQEGVTHPGDVDELEKMRSSKNVNVPQFWERRKRWQERRIKNITRHLRRRLERYVDGDRDGFEHDAWTERKELVLQPAGPQMLEAIGFAYCKTAAKVKALLCSGIVGRLKSAAKTTKQCGHWLHLGARLVSQAIRSKRIQSRMEHQLRRFKDSDHNETELRQLTEELKNQATESAKELMWSFSRMDIEYAIGDAVQRITTESGVSKDILVLRCEALEKLGDIFRDRTTTTGFFGDLFQRWSGGSPSTRRAPHESKATYPAASRSAGVVRTVYLRPGDVVRIYGLKHYTEHNEQYARVEDWKADGSRKVIIVLKTGTKLIMHPSNLERMPCSVFRPGDRVRVFGLQQATQHNDQLACVEELKADATGRVVILLDDGKKLIVKYFNLEHIDKPQEVSLVAPFLGGGGDRGLEDVSGSCFVGVCAVVAIVGLFTTSSALLRQRYKSASAAEKEPFLNT